MSVDDLRVRDVNVDDAEVARQTVADEGTAKVEKDPQLFVDFLVAASCDMFASKILRA